MRKISSKLYDKKYFLHVVEGYQSFNDFLTKINPKFKKALKLANLKKSEKVLDVGCGRGEMVFYSALLHNCNATGIDYSEDAISICNDMKKRLNMENDKRIQFFHIDENKLPFENEIFDVIFFMDIWEHIYSEQMDQILREFRRILKDSGRIIIHTSPNKKFFDVGFPRYTYYFNYILNEIFYKPFLKKKMARSNVDPRSEYEKVMHVNEQTFQSVKLSLRKAGLEGKIFVDDYFIMFSNPALFFYYLIAQPFYMPFLKNIFGEHIWAIIKKE